MTVSPLTIYFLDFLTLPWYCGVATRSVRLVGKLMYRKESNMNTEELYKQYIQLLRGAPVDYGYRIAPKSPKHKALLTAFFRPKV